MNGRERVVVVVVFAPRLSQSNYLYHLGRPPIVDKSLKCEWSQKKLPGVEETKEKLREKMLNSYTTKSSSGVNVINEFG